MRTNPFTRRGGLLAALAALTLSAYQRQGDVQVSARLSAGVMRLGDTGQINVTVENADDVRVLELPAVEGLIFGRPSEPHRRQFTSFANGRVYSENSATVVIPVRPEAEGDYEIPPIPVEVGGRRFETRPLRVTVVRDIQGEDFGYIEVRPSASRVIEGQPLTVELHFGWDSSQQVSFAQLNLPWWDSLPGAIELGEPPIPQERRVDGIEVNGRVRVTAEQLEDRQRNGRSFIALRLVKTYLPTRSGTLEFPTSFFEFGTRRQLSFLDARRESHFVQAEPFVVEVLSLPSEGQPLDFSGAVGTLAARASADARDVRVGDSIKLTVEWTGQGNLSFFRAPDPAAIEAFRGFRVYGTTEEKTPERRKVVYDLAPLSSDVQEIPPLSLSVFDPMEGRYETVATAPIPIRVRALEKGASLEDEEKRFERDIADIDARPPSATGARGEARGQDAFLLAALVGVPALGLVARARTRRRAGDPAAPLERRRRRARRVLARALSRADDPGARQAAVLEYLAARTREPAAAWNGRDVARWAPEHAPALPEALRRETAQVLADLEAAVYGGGAPVAPVRILALAQALEGGGL